MFYNGYLNDPKTLRNLAKRRMCYCVDFFSFQTEENIYNAIKDIIVKEDRHGLHAGIQDDLQIVSASHCLKYASYVCVVWAAVPYSIYICVAVVFS